MEHIKLHNLY